MKFLIVLALVAASSASPLLLRNDIWGTHPWDIASPLRSTILAEPAITAGLIGAPLRSTILAESAITAGLIGAPLRSTILAEPAISAGLIGARSTVLSPVIAHVPADTNLVTPITTVGLVPTTGLVHPARTLVHSAHSLLI